MKTERSGQLSRRGFGAIATALNVLRPALAQGKPGAEVSPGVWRVRLGNPERLTPVQTRLHPPATDRLADLPVVAKCPVLLGEVSGRASRRGYVATLPLQPREMVYGLGLQFQSFLQRGLKKKLRVNADPTVDTGDSHAPVPFYVTTNGYGILIDSARYVNIYCGNKKKKTRGGARTAEGQDTSANSVLPAAYSRFHMDEPSQVLVEIPEASGVDIYIFGGPEMRSAVQRYNLFSGGGALPPRWALGFWYRCYGQFNQSEVLRTASDLRNRKIPCDVLGLEPGWQSHAYSCSFTWSDKFPDPGKMINSLAKTNYRVNLWEHAFTHPTSPIYKPLFPFSGDYEVWDGLVPDFMTKEARDIFGEFHQREHVALGVSGYKLDECDNSDFTRNWSFPELSRFPSGVDGEQMHCFFGIRYQETIQSIYQRRNTRTFGLVRSSHALAAPHPYALYSDLYNHQEFIRGLVNSGFSGLLWCPEVRDAENTEDLVRRLQTVIFSPVAMVNAWYIKNPPWKQVNQAANNSGDFAGNWEQLESLCSELIELRMKLVPYLYSAFVNYYRSGTPPFRAVVMDCPGDTQTWTIDDQFLAGENLLVAPVVAGQQRRTVYLPDGQWFDFWTGEEHNGRQRLEVVPPLEQIPLFVKSGTLLPLAKPTLSTDHPASFNLSVRVYGHGQHSFVLYEDDGLPAPEFTQVRLTWDATKQAGSVERTGPKRGHSYTVTKWERVVPKTSGV
jgi:alpha-D-xyloside xylohydrolase